MKRSLTLTLVGLAALLVGGCSQSLPNDDPRASVAGTSKFKNMTPGGAAPATGSK